jgi:hypothetical protein
MKTLLTTTLLAAGLSLSTASYSAAVDFIDNGNYTTDTISGLDWLDINETTGRSYQYVTSRLSTGGAYEGWRYATSTEFLAMAGNFTGKSYTDPYARNYEPTGTFTDLIDLIGITIDNSSNNYSITAGLLSDTDTHGRHRYAALLNYLVPSTNEAYVQAFNGVLSDNTRSFTVGSFLVRDTALSAVPIPPAALMFAPALLGLLGLRHKRRA